MLSIRGVVSICAIVPHHIGVHTKDNLKLSLYLSKTPLKYKTVLELQTPKQTISQIYNDNNLGLKLTIVLYCLGVKVKEN